MEELTQGSVTLERCGGWREGYHGDMMGTDAGILGGEEDTVSSGCSGC